MIKKNIEDVIEDLLDSDKEFNPINYSKVDQTYFHDNIFKCRRCGLWTDILEESETKVHVCIGCER